MWIDSSFFATAAAAALPIALCRVSWPGRRRLGSPPLRCQICVRMRVCVCVTAFFFYANFFILIFYAPRACPACVCVCVCVLVVLFFAL